MSWSSRRRFTYITGIVVFFGILFGGPLAYKFLTIPPTCFDGQQNQKETSIDKGGPCVRLDEALLQPHALMWVRGFKVRDGTYNAVAYIQNPNERAGAESVRYRISMYDSDNILVAERFGTTFIMPGGITPVIESHIDTGYRDVARTYFEFLEQPAWKNSVGRASSLVVSEKNTIDVLTEPRVTAVVRNPSVDTLNKVEFIATVFDPGGNAIQASATAVEVFYPNTAHNLVFTWPDPFAHSVGRVDVMPRVAPVIVDPVTGRRI